MPKTYVPAKSRIHLPLKATKSRRILMMPVQTALKQSRLNLSLGGDFKYRLINALVTDRTRRLAIFPFAL